MVINATADYTSISEDKWQQLKMQTRPLFAYKTEDLQGDMGSMSIF